MNQTLFGAALLLLATQALAQVSNDDVAWPVAGQQGLMRFVIVPVEAARARPAYMKQIERLCEPDRTCFLNFYTNSSDAPVAVPLPDAIDREATAVFRRSSKQAVSSFRWSCRLQMPDANCF
jgi:hypothetical protein